eukprot:763392-Hanusia_phi.AAC.2
MDDGSLRQRAPVSERRKRRGGGWESSETLCMIMYDVIVIDIDQVNRVNRTPLSRPTGVRVQRRESLLSVSFKSWVFGFELSHQGVALIGMCKDAKEAATYPCLRTLSGHKQPLPEIHQCIISKKTSEKNNFLPELSLLHVNMLTAEHKVTSLYDHVLKHQEERACGNPSSMKTATKYIISKRREPDK